MERCKPKLSAGKELVDQKSIGSKIQRLKRGKKSRNSFRMSTQVIVLSSANEKRSDKPPQKITPPLTTKSQAQRSAEAANSEPEKRKGKRQNQNPHAGKGGLGRGRGKARGYAAGRGRHWSREDYRPIDHERDAYERYFW